MLVAGCHCARGVTQQQPVVVAREQDDRWGGAGTAADGVDDILPHCGVGGIHRRGRSPVVWGLLAAGKLSARRPAADPCAPELADRSGGHYSAPAGCATMPAIFIPVAVSSAPPAGRVRVRRGGPAGTGAAEPSPWPVDSIFGARRTAPCAAYCRRRLSVRLLNGLSPCVDPFFPQQPARTCAPQHGVFPPVLAVRVARHHQAGAQVLFLPSRVHLGRVSPAPHDGDPRQPQPFGGARGKHKSAVVTGVYFGRPCRRGRRRGCRGEHDERG